MLRVYECQRDVVPLFRYPQIMTDEGIGVVRQWLGATNQLEEGESAGPYSPRAPASFIVQGPPQRECLQSYISLD